MRLASSTDLDPLSGGGPACPDLANPLLYVASRASLPQRPQMWRSLRAEGWRIASTWIDEAGVGETENFADLWRRVEDELRAADGLILYAERDDFPLKGALVEVGMALGMRKPVAVVLNGPPLPGAALPSSGWFVAAPWAVRHIPQRR